MATLFDEWAQSEGGSKYNALQGMKKQQATPAATKKKKGFWTDQISTGGGIGGALGGAAAGAAIGSVVPIAGTAVGGLLGALIGGGLGSAAGEAGENAIMGEDLSKNVLKEGLIGGVTSVPIGAGFKLARAGVNAATGLGKKSASELVQEAGMQTIGKGTTARMAANGTLDKQALDAMTRLQAGKAATKAGKGIENTASKMLASQSLVTPSQARNMGLDTVGTFGNINKRTGMTNIDDMAEVGRSLTGAGDKSLLDTLTRSALGEAKGVNAPDLRRVAQDLIDNGGSVISDEQRKRVLGNMTRAGVTMRGGAAGSISDLADPGKALDQANVFRATARDLTNSFNVTPEQKQLAAVYNGVADQMEKSIYGAVGVDASLPLLTKAGADDLLFMSQEAATAGNKAQADAYARLADELRGVKSIPELRSMKRDFVSLGKIDNATAQAQGARTLGGADISKKAGEAVRNPLNLLALPLDAATPRIAGGLAKTGQALQSRGAAPVGQSLLGATVRQAGGRALMAEDQSQQPATLEEALLAQQQMSGDPMAQAGMDEPVAEAPSNPFGVSRDEVAQALVRAMQANDKAAIAQLQDLYGMVSDYEDAQTETTSMNATTQKALAQSANADSTLTQLEELLGNAGGAGGPVGGNIASFFGNMGLNGDAKTYNDLAAGSVTQIAKALGETGAMSDSDRIAYQALLPKITDTPEVAANKFRALRARMAAAHQNTMQYGAGVEPGLEQALLSGGY